MDRWDISALPDYGPFMDKVKAARDNFVRKSSTPELVAEVIYKAATDRPLASQIGQKHYRRRSRKAPLDAVEKGIGVFLSPANRLKRLLP